jgi:hypothetical protein
MLRSRRSGQNTSRLRCPPPALVRGHRPDWNRYPFLRSCGTVTVVLVVATLPEASRQETVIV